MHKATAAAAKRHRFASTLDLARLPYFDLVEGRLRLADRSLGPAIDCHAHLALSYLRRPRVDLLQEHPRTEHYLPVERPLDLHVYVNGNFLEEDLRAMRRDLTLMSATARGMRATHTLPNLRREMADLGITKAVLLPIDFPVLSRNAATYLEVAGGDDSFVVFGSVHPLAARMTSKLARQKQLGARGVKVHPAVQMTRPDHPWARRLYRLCGALALPVLFHCGPAGIEPKAGQRRAQVRFYERPVAENPGTPFVLGHSGARQMDGALALAKRYPNVWLELSSQSLDNVRRILDEAPAERVLFGTDWPFYHQAIALAKVLIATEGDAALRRKVLHDNAARLLGLPPAAA